MTYTFTRYFSESSLTDLRSAVQELVKDWQRRSVHVDSAAQEAVEHRLKILSSSIELLNEPVPPSFGG